MIVKWGKSSANFTTVFLFLLISSFLVTAANDHRFIRVLKSESLFLEHSNTDWLKNRTIVPVTLPNFCDEKHSNIPNFPFTVVNWPAIHTKSCPHYLRGSHRAEKGGGLSHFQLFLEFQFFDNDVDEARFRKTPEFISSTSYSSVSGLFQAFPNGTLYKNGVPFLDTDLLLVFDGNIQENTILKGDIWSDLRSELLAMEVDILSLAACTSVSDRNQFCMAAYAVTRKGVRIIASNYDVCGSRLSAQVMKMANLGLIKISRSSNNYFLESACTNKYKNDN